MPRAAAGSTSSAPTTLRQDAWAASGWLRSWAAKATWCIFTFTGQPNTEERLKGFKDVFSSHPDLKIVDVVDIKADPKIAFDKTQEYMALTGPKKIDAFICLDSASGKPVSDAVARVSGANRLVIAWDVSPDTLAAIKAGTIDSTVVQKPYTMGYVGLKALDQIFHDPPGAVRQGLQRPIRSRRTRRLWIRARRWWTRTTWMSTLRRRRQVASKAAALLPRKTRGRPSLLDGRRFRIEGKS